jgi:hypothetical protein
MITKTSPKEIVERFRKGTLNIDNKTINGAIAITVSS